MLTARLGGVDATLRALRDALDVQLAAAFDREGRRVAAEAQRTHPFQNRTGELEASIAPVDTTGRLSGDDLAGGVEAAMPYASFVEDRPELEFLNLAYLLTEDAFERDADEALAAAARVAGLSTE